MCVLMCVCMHVCVCMCACMHACVHACVCALRIVSLDKILCYIFYNFFFFLSCLRLWSTFSHSHMTAWFTINCCAKPQSVTSPPSHCCPLHFQLSVVPRFCILLYSLCFSWSLGSESFLAYRKPPWTCDLSLESVDFTFYLSSGNVVVYTFCFHFNICVWPEEGAL